MEHEDIRDAVFEAIELSLDAQLRAVRRLRKGEEGGAPQRRKGRSQLDMAYDILLKAGVPMHVTDIIRRIGQRFGEAVDRESLVSALTKRVARGDRFERTEPNTFGLRKDGAQ